MAIFQSSSRYLQHAKKYPTVDSRGQLTVAVSAASAPEQSELGVHVMKQGQRLDHLAAHYLDEPTAFWRICELNDVIVPDVLLGQETVKIPSRG